MAPRPLCALYDVFTDHDDKNSVHGKPAICKGSFPEATFAEADADADAEAETQLHTA